MALILASSSPRRQELLAKITTDFKVVPADIDETVSGKLSPEEYVLSMAQQKAQVVYKEFPADVVIGCDTIVACEGRILGKPRDRDDAREMLTFLSGKTHLVYTSVQIIGQGKIVQGTFPAEVAFFDLSVAEIDAYLATGEHSDKAGSYGIQGQGALLVKFIKGDYYSIVGFPVAHIAKMLANFA